MIRTEHVAPKFRLLGWQFLKLSDEILNILAEFSSHLQNVNANKSLNVSNLKCNWHVADIVTTLPRFSAEVIYVQLIYLSIFIYIYIYL